MREQWTLGTTILVPKVLLPRSLICWLKSLFALIELWLVGAIFSTKNFNAQKSLILFFIIVDVQLIYRPLSYPLRSLQVFQHFSFFDLLDKTSTFI